MEIFFSPVTIIAIAAVIAVGFVVSPYEISFEDHGDDIEW